MKKFALFVASLLLVMPLAQAFNVNLLANNKEILSRQVTRADLMNLSYWKKQHRLAESELKESARLALADTFNELESADSACELGLVEKLEGNAIRHGVINTISEMMNLITYMRNTNLIDDILHAILSESLRIKISFVNNSTLKPRFGLFNRSNSGVDLQKLYAPFKTWPDEEKKCSFDVYYSLTREANEAQLSRLNSHAYRAGIIDLATYNKLEVLRLRQVIYWDVYLSRYIDIIKNSKDKLTKSVEPEAQNGFVVEYVSRKSPLTRRSHLYRTYTSTQVMILSQVMEKTAKRMDSTQVTLNWQYTEDPNGEREVYIFSPTEQYRAAIKMLRKDMAELMRSEAFKNTGLEFEHIIAAAYETGFIKNNELQQVLKFQEFWNPKVPKWRALSNFAFSIAGSATFYLPPPFNILGAVALIFTQSAMANQGRKPDPDDNWNVII